MKYFILLFLLVCFSQNGSAQYISKGDSVIATLDTYSDIEKIDTLISLAYFPLGNVAKARESIIFAQEAKVLALEHNELEKYAKALELEGIALGTFGKMTEGIDSVKKSMEIGERLENKLLIAQGYFSLGYLYKANDKLLEAIYSYKKSLNLFNQLQNKKSASVVSNLATACLHAGNYDEALTYYLQAEEIFKVNNDSIHLARIYSGLSMVYEDLGNYPKAFSYVVKAIDLQKEEGQEFSLSISFLSAGSIQKGLENYDSAFYFNQEALNISIALEDTVGIAFAKFNIASVYYNKNELDQSISHYLEAAKLLQDQKYTSKSIMCYTNLSICYLENSDSDNALNFANKALELSKQINNNRYFSSVYKTLYTIYLDRNEYKLALGFRDLQILYKDSLIDEQKVKEIAKIETNYEIKSRDSEISLLNKNKEIAQIKAQENQRVRYFLIVIAFLLLFIIAFIYNRFLAQKKNKLELSEANEQLKELNISKNKFFAIIAHDLRNPIAAFNNLTSALISNFKHLSEEQLLNYLNNLNKSSSKINGLLENLLQWALSQTEALSLEHKDFDLSKVIQKNIDLLAQNAKQKNISFSFNKPSGVVAYADQSTIDIVFRNIISNAIKFSENGGKISIETELTNEEIEIRIKDKGIGMSAGEIEMLFDITKDTASIGSSTEKGSGLGLLLCNEYIKKSNGEINVLSKINEGATVIIKLPRTQPKAA